LSGNSTYVKISLFGKSASKGWQNIIINNISAKISSLPYLHGLNSGLVAAQLALEPLVLLAQILDAGQISPVIIRGDEQLLLLDPALLVGNVAEELLQRVALVEEALAVSGQVLDAALCNRNYFLRFRF
jgi:hypothetical protein